MSEKIRFIPASGTEIYVPPPQWGYVSTIVLPVKTVELTNGRMARYDAGGSYDIRKCECKFLFNETDAASFINFFDDNSRGRGDNVTMRLATGSGFYPFGPDYGDAGDFTVRLIKMDQTGSLHRPWKHFEIACTLVLVSNPPYVIPPARPEGTLTFGMNFFYVEGVRPPEDSFSVKIEQRKSEIVTLNSTPYTVDKPKEIDRYATTMVMSDNTVTTARIMEFITRSTGAGIRDTTPPYYFELTSMSGHYPFGRFGKNASGSINTVQLLNDSISMTHKRYDRFDFDLTLLEV